MSGKDIVELLEYLQANKHSKTKRFKRTDDFDIVELLRRKHEETKLLEEWLKNQEMEKLKNSPRKVHKLTWSEGMIIAYVAQLVLPPLWKAFAHNMGIQ